MGGETAARGYLEEQVEVYGEAKMFDKATESGPAKLGRRRQGPAILEPDARRCAGRKKANPMTALP